MAITLRPATEADVADLARLYILATAGLVDAAYDGLEPGVPLETLTEWRFTQLGSVRSYEHCRMAQAESDVAGMMNAFPIDRLDDAPSDPRLTPDRAALFAPIIELLHQGAGTYYISAVAVYPQFRGRGIARQLMTAATSDARRLGFADLSLVSFEQNAPALTLYQRLGFETTARSPVIPHPLIQYTGDLLLMRRRL